MSLLENEHNIYSLWMCLPVLDPSSDVLLT